MADFFISYASMSVLKSEFIDDFFNFLEIIRRNIYKFKARIIELGIYAALAPFGPRVKKKKLFLLGICCPQNFQMKDFACLDWLFTHNHKALGGNINEKSQQFLGVAVHDPEIINKVPPLHTSFPGINHHILLQADICC